MRELIYGRNAVREVLRANRRQAYKLLVAEGKAPTFPDITV